MFFGTTVDLQFTGQYWIAQTHINIQPGERVRGEMAQYVFENGGHQTFCGNGPTAAAALTSLAERAHEFIPPYVKKLGS